MIANSQLFYNVFQIRNKKQENTCHENFSYVYFILIRVYDILTLTRGFSIENHLLNTTRNKKKKSLSQQNLFRGNFNKEYRQLEAKINSIVKIKSRGVSIQTTYPLNTPRTRLSTKKEPQMIRVTK